MYGGIDVRKSNNFCFNQDWIVILRRNSSTFRVFRAFAGKWFRFLKSIAKKGPPAKIHLEQKTRMNLTDGLSPSGMSYSDLSAFIDLNLLEQYEQNPAILKMIGLVPHETPGVTRQFLEDASTYHEIYFKPNEFGPIIQQAFDHSGFKIGPNLVALDLGSGSGNTAIPLLNLTSDIKVLATDISPQLLSIMECLVRQRPQDADRIAYICMDCHQNAWRENSVDLVVGTAILHHLINPKAAVHAALYALKPGGIAIFHEPFEYGAAIQKTIYRLILDRSHRLPGLDPVVADFLTRMIRDFEARFGPETLKPFTADLDDKWLFHTGFFEQFGEEFDLEQINPIFDPTPIETWYSYATSVDLQLGGCTDIGLPDWAWEIVASFDRGISDDLKRQFIREATIILKRRVISDHQTRDI